MRTLLPIVLALVLAALPHADAQEIVLRLHHFLSESSPVHAEYLEPWARRVEEASDGRIAVEIFSSMQLGGAPASLYDQVATGVVDLAWTLPGYTPGRFPMTEVFELPFMSGLAEDASPALCAFYQEHLQSEYGEVRPIALHTSGAGLFHVRGTTIRDIDDLAGLKIRGPSRVTTEAPDRLGAEPIGMPVPQVPEALARGVVDGALLPWEVTAPLRIAELVDGHTGFDARHGLYASTFLLAMNRDAYERLPGDLRAAIDVNSMAAGCDESRFAGATLDAADERARALAEREGNDIHTIPNDAVRAWEERLAPLHARWIRDMNALGFDGEALLERARELIAAYEAD